MINFYNLLSLDCLNHLLQEINHFAGIFYIDFSSSSYGQFKEEILFFEWNSIKSTTTSFAFLVIGIFIYLFNFIQMQLLIATMGNNTMRNHERFQQDGVGKDLLQDLVLCQVIMGRVKEAKLYSEQDAVRQWNNSEVEYLSDA